MSRTRFPRWRLAIRSRDLSYYSAEVYYLADAAPPPLSAPLSPRVSLFALAFARCLRSDLASVRSSLPVPVVRPVPLAVNGAAPWQRYVMDSVRVSSHFFVVRSEKLCFLVSVSS